MTALGYSTLTEENNCPACLQNPLNMFNLKYCAMKLEISLGSDEVQCLLYDCFGGSDKSETLHTRYPRCSHYVRVFTG
jgi:hypothetical protein